ncbi:unnamed protein product [Lathyrus oleraceus]
MNEQIQTEKHLQTDAHFPPSSRLHNNSSYYLNSSFARIGLLTTSPCFRALWNSSFSICFFMNCVHQWICTWNVAVIKTNESQQGEERRLTRFLSSYTVALCTRV